MGHTKNYQNTESIKQNLLVIDFIQHGAKCIKPKNIEHQQILNSYHVDYGDKGGDKGKSCDVDGRAVEGGNGVVLEVKRVVIMAG